MSIPANANVTVLNKNEKKAREMISKFSLKRVPGIVRVAFRKKNNEIIAVDKPDVYRTVGGNYVVFGEAKVDDFTKKLADAQQQMEKSGISDVSGDKSPADIQKDMQAAAAETEGEAGAEAGAAEDEEVDSGDLSNDDVVLVMEQASVSKAKAVKALKEHGGDIVNAIMSLSK
ncbi:Egd2p KNAG_0M00300 [Huiozyma naganishii CBS 8797]|uniref:Nascent polypeptide-associated complex subunit alpha n=1 Tax=Huiozyma naganishii (strain ATCC MYA-139 / BCRC 22969 / CBS 8797 / KCTC 17520 / NBRC 10181 / NCYC 3082 / Yp74L-3) TaxID=1071383 RepID=J7RSI7_HUIN7|nr:hypothetical protein KNAG_0M00300 [Kazachstania naganishii CBS 8797]CCK72883.1 hypothetical protein KNAG_0M00300 [Kazachstania naganishii CBS 8797]